MANYSDLPVCKASYDLILGIFRFTKNYAKEYKYKIGESIKKETITFVMLIYQANGHKVKAFILREAFPDAQRAIEKLYEMPSRKAMTSGTLTKVPDRSAFVRFLVERLTDNTEKYLSSEQLFSSFRMAVINNSDAVPQYGEISNVGDQGGDFIFIKK